MLEWLGMVTLTIGSCFIVLAALGVHRFPDVLMRMAAASKATTLGGVCLCLGGVILPESRGAWLQLICAGSFLLLAGPIAAHLLGRAVLRSSIPLVGQPGVWRDLQKKGGGQQE